MATAARASGTPRSASPEDAGAAPLPLQSGDRLTRAEFEHRYAAMPHLKAELIEGVVYVTSPVSNRHGAPHSDLNLWLGLYRMATPGVVASIEGTVRLDEDNEPQPDVHLRILPEFGGQAVVDGDDYVAGAPELVAEVALSSASYDLHDKLNVYRRNLVREYLVWRVANRAIDWFVQRQGRFERLALGADGLYRSEVFPGLWLDPAALVRGDLTAVALAVQRGLATPEHAAFVERPRQAAAQPGGDRP